MTIHKQTIATYDNAAEDMAAHFQNYGGGVAREEIIQAFSLAQCDHRARIVEIGCGAGKDAAELVKRASFYEGFDPSEKLLELAQEHVAEGTFLVADATSYDYPAELDIVFAFASMLHLNQEEFAATCEKVAAALRPGGIFCMTLKEADKYKDELQKDEFGERLFYFYNPTLVRELAGDSFEQVYEMHEVVGPKQKRWFTIMLQKQ